LAKKASKLPDLKGIIYFDAVPPEALAELKRNNVKAITLEELEKLGENNPGTFNPPTADDIAVIMYTSGSTGLPVTSQYFFFSK
jgi:long-chain acyl-CoA synthetase